MWNVDTAYRTSNGCQRLSSTFAGAHEQAALSTEITVEGLCFRPGEAVEVKRKHLGGRIRRIRSTRDWALGAPITPWRGDAVGGVGDRAWYPRIPLQRPLGWA